jgi:hypothetical protein
MFVLLCVEDLQRYDPPSKKVLPTVYRIENLGGGGGTTKVQRAVEP